jgi:hypothetical protein
VSPAVLTIISAAALAAAGIAVASRGTGETPAATSRAVLNALGPQAYAPGTARAGATTRAAGIPLPAGGNFNGIRWELSDGEIPAGTIDVVLQYNAACQWLRAWRRGSLSALGVLRRATTWSAFRAGGEVRLADVAAEASRGGGKDVTAMLADCNASHRREVSYARRLGLAPST